MRQDKGQAEKFLAALDREENVFSFHGYDPEKIKPERAYINGTIDAVWDMLVELNDKGYGIYVTVNQFEGRRLKENIRRIRAIWQEDDDHFNGDLPLDPSMVINTSPGKYHRYWLTVKKATDDTVKEFDGAMRGMVERYGSDKNAKDICRVLRLPGLFNTKPELPQKHLVKVINGTERRIPWKQLVETFEPPPRPERPDHERESTANLEEALDALHSIPADIDRESWRNIGTALKEGFEDAARGAWIAWSKTSSNPKHNDTEAQLEKQWNSLDVNAGVRLRTLFHHAKEHGWTFSQPHSASFSRSQPSQSHSASSQHDSASFSASLDSPHGNQTDLTVEVDRFVSESTAAFTNKDVYSEVCANNHVVRKSIRNRLAYLEKQRIISRISGHNATWERIQGEDDQMSFEGKSASEYKVPLPLNILDHAILRPGAIVIIAGEPNCGKTTFMLRLIKMLEAEKKRGGIHPEGYNKKNIYPEGPINYINSEMSEVELIARVESMGSNIQDWEQWVNFYKRNHSFHQRVSPDSINLIDYLEVVSDYTEAGRLILQLHEKLKTGIAIIGLQKNPKSQLGYGGGPTLQKPRLYINLKRNLPHGFIAEAVKVKEARDFRNKIEGMEIDYHITEDGQFVPDSGWRYVNDKQRTAINAEYSRKYRK